MLRVYASSLSQAGGTHSWWVPLVVRGEKHTPITRCIFSFLLPSVLFPEGTCLNILSFYCLLFCSLRVIVSIFYALILMP